MQRIALPNCDGVCDCASRDLAPVYYHWPEEPWRLEKPILPRFAGCCAGGLKHIRQAPTTWSTRTDL